MHKTEVEIELDRVTFGTTKEDKASIIASLDKNIRETKVIHKADGKDYQVLTWSRCKCMIGDMNLKIETGWFAIEQFVLG